MQKSKHSFGRAANGSPTRMENDAITTVYACRNGLRWSIIRYKNWHAKKIHFVVHLRRHTRSSPGTHTIVGYERLSSCLRVLQGKKRNSFLYSVLYSDNGTSFVAASKAIPHIKWEFITPLAPWHGAIWERLVRSIKAPLRKVVGGARLKEVELRVVLTKIEGVINSRPLTVLKGDETRQITPAELINGRPLGKIDIPYVQLDATRRLQHLERTKEQFWKQWQKCYLPSLQSRAKWQTRCPNVKEGDIVLLLKENTKRHTWPLAKVLETVVGRDNLVRTVKVICDGKEIVRPIQHIVPLEVPSDENEHIGSRD